MNGRVRGLILAVGFTVTACAFMPSGATLEGTATYRERIALPPGATLEVTLEDVSRADASAEVLRQTRIPARAPPIPFKLEFNPAQIVEGRRYAVRARILDGRDLLFATDTFNAAFVDGKPAPLDLVLRMTAPDAP